MSRGFGNLYILEYSVITYLIWRSWFALMGALTLLDGRTSLSNPCRATDSMRHVSVLTAFLCPTIGAAREQLYAIFGAVAALLEQSWHAVLEYEERSSLGVVIYLSFFSVAFFWGRAVFLFKSVMGAVQFDTWDWMSRVEVTPRCSQPSEERWKSHNHERISTSVTIVASLSSPRPPLLILHSHLVSRSLFSHWCNKAKRSLDVSRHQDHRHSPIWIKDYQFFSITDISQAAIITIPISRDSQPRIGGSMSSIFKRDNLSFLSSLPFNSCHNTRLPYGNLGSERRRRAIRVNLYLFQELPFCQSVFIHPDTTSLHVGASLQNDEHLITWQEETQPSQGTPKPDTCVPVEMLLPSVSLNYNSRDETFRLDAGKIENYYPITQESRNDDDKSGLPLNTLETSPRDDTFTEIPEIKSGTTQLDQRCSDGEQLLYSSSDSPSTEDFSPQSASSVHQLSRDFIVTPEGLSNPQTVGKTQFLEASLNEMRSQVSIDSHIPSNPAGTVCNGGEVLYTSSAPTGNTSLRGDDFIETSAGIIVSDRAEQVIQRNFKRVLQGPSTGRDGWIAITPAPLNEIPRLSLPPRLKHTLGPCFTRPLLSRSSFPVRAKLAGDRPNALSGLRAGVPLVNSFRNRLSEFSRVNAREKLRPVPMPPVSLSSNSIRAIWDDFPARYSVPLPVNHTNIPVILVESVDDPSDNDSVDYGTTPLVPVEALLHDDFNLTHVTALNPSERDSRYHPSRMSCLKMGNGVFQPF